MKLKDVEVGKRYLVHDSGQLQVVRVTELKQVHESYRSSWSARRTLIIGVDEATGRELTIRSLRRLRSLVEG